MERNVRPNCLGNLVVLTIAVADQIGRPEILLADQAGGPVLKRVGTPLDPADSIMVETSTSDSLVQAEEIRPPDVVKIDVEGAEMQLLRGMSKIPKNARPSVTFELDDATEKKREEKLEVCREFLLDLRCRVEMLPNSYGDGNWFARHVLSTRP